jgi:hypothetical protein
VKDITIVEGRCFYAQSEPEQAGFWSVYNKDGSYVESLRGNIYTARERLNALDFDVLIRRLEKQQRGARRKDRASQVPEAALAPIRRKRRTT